MLDLRYSQPAASSQDDQRDLEQEPCSVIPDLAMDQASSFAAGRRRAEGCLHAGCCCAPGRTTSYTLACAMTGWCLVLCRSPCRWRNTIFDASRCLPSSTIGSAQVVMLGRELRVSNPWVVVMGGGMTQGPGKEGRRIMLEHANY